MKRLTITFSLVIVAALLVVALTAQTTDTSGDVTLTATMSDPEVAVVIDRVEFSCLNPRRCAQPSARICYDYIRQSGAYSRMACRAATGDELYDSIDATGTAAGNTLMDYLAVRTSTAQPPNDWRRFQNRLRAWTQQQGWTPEAPTATTGT